MPASAFSQSESLPAKGSSLLGRSGTLNFGSTAPDRRYLRIVFRDSPVRREIARIEMPSRRAQRRMTPNNAMSITPYTPAVPSRGRFEHGSILSGKSRLTRVSSQRNSTFEPDRGSEDALLSFATLWNSNLLVEALRVEDDDDPTPVPSVRERFDRWACAARTGRRPATVRLPGREGSYVLFAAAGPGLIACSGTGGRVQAVPEGGKGGVGQPAGTPVSFF